MDILILNIPFCNKYNGIEDNFLNTYDKFFKEKKGAFPEFYNFQDYNGNCYGYVSAKEGIVNLSEINFKNNEDLLFEKILILWVSKNDKNNNYKLIGWYKNAQVFKYLQKKISFPSVGRDLYFNTKASSKDCFLLPLEDRNFLINLNFENNCNILLKDEKDLSNVLEFINSYKKERFNTIYNKNILNEIIEFAPNNPISLAKRASIFMYNENNFLEAIKFFNSALLYKDSLNKQEILNIKYEKAICLQLLNCFDFAIEEFEKILEIANYNFNICKNLMYLYFITENFEKSINVCNKILENEPNIVENKNILEEINCFKAEAYIYLNNFEKAKLILNKVVKHTENEQLKLNCYNILEKIKNHK